ncbi:MAG: Nif3-like dinuclear metal center hexameric protein [Rhodothermales bacterium]|nr:Nif3-like dinuclear metal center hexameric protein [Rhodothermales bacterium]
MMTVGDILDAIEGWAPSKVAQSYDNVGLLVGDRSQKVEKILTALDLVPAVVDEAIETGSNLIITHHPTIFNPLKTVTGDSLEGSMIIRLIQAGISLIASHTNLDATEGGVSFALAEKLGLQDVTFLQPVTGKTLKLVTFVPVTAMETVRDALAEAGAGVIGKYDSCGFGIEGVGNFRPLEGANPHAGQVHGDIHSEKEIRYEVELPEWILQRVIRALKEAHPYEEVAYDIYSVQQASTRFGMGAIGILKKQVELADFLRLVSEKLEVAAIRFVGDTARPVRTIAVCGGSGSSLTGEAIRQGADAYVTGDITYHRFFDALDTNGAPAIALVDAGHYETEFMTRDLLRDFIQSKFSSVIVRSTSVKTSPIDIFTP